MKNFFETFFRAIVLPRFQITAIIFNLIILLALGYQATREFHAIEPSPQLLPITPKKMQEWGGEPAPVKVGMHIINFPQFEIVANKLVMDAIIWFEFDPAHVSLDTISKFSFEKGKLEYKSEPDTKLIEGKMFAEYEIRLQFTTSLSYKHFPFDDHRIYIALVNTFVTPSELIFQAYKPGFSLSENVFIAEWTYVDNDVQSGYTEAILDKHDARKVTRFPKVIFSIDFRRSGVRKVLLILFPLFLIFFIGLFSFAFDPVKNASMVLSLASGSVASLISYRFVIQRMSPDSGYFLLGDHIFSIFLIFAFVELLIAISIVRSGKLTTSWAIARGIAFLMFHILFLSLWYYLLFIWMGK